jgi:hypothetical protein
MQQQHFQQATATVEPSGGDGDVDSRKMVTVGDDAIASKSCRFPKGRQ